MTRRVLFCTIGQTPQIVTETVWCLLRRTPPWVPDEVHIVTTTLALPRVIAKLQAADGPLAGLFGGTPPPVTVHVPRRCGKFDLFPPLRGSADGALGSAHERAPATSADALPDVNSAEDATIMGDLILRLMAGFVRDDETHVHVSLAGGRKTMSAHALLALTLVGRPSDEASHVLVSPAEFEDNFDFWHPDQGGMIAPRRKPGQADIATTERLDPAAATVTLVRTPTPLLRFEVRQVASLEQLRLADATEQVRLAALLSEHPHIRLDTATNLVTACGIARRLAPKPFAVYRLIATAWKERWPGVGPDGDEFESDSTCCGWLSVPQICCGHSPAGQSIEVILLHFIRDAVVAAGGDPQGHASVREWEDKIVAEPDPRKKLAHAQTAIGSLNRLTESLANAFGAPAATIIAPARVDRRQGRPIRGGRIWVGGATRFGLRPQLAAEAIEIV